MSSGNNFTLRSAAENDAVLLTKLHQESFSTYWNIESFNNFFTVDRTYALLVENPAPAGMIVYRIAHEQADIITIAVLTVFRRRGMASALLKQAMEHMATEGVHSIFLDVEDGNAAALSLYEKQGFTLLKRRKQYYQQKDGSFTDALVMVRKLA